MTPRSLPGAPGTGVSSAWLISAVLNRTGSSSTANQSPHALIRAHRERVARELEVIEDEAARLILTGCASELPKITIYGYAPLGADGEVAPGASVFFPGSGWTNAEGTAEFHTLTEQLPPRILDLDEISTHRIAGYAPSTGMKAYAVARDGTWVWPGCSQPAERCQLDHRVPF